MKKAMFFFCIILIILLTGCGTQNYSLKVNDDNSVEYKIRITVDSTTYDLLSSYGVDMSNLNRNKKSYGDEDIDSLDAVFQEQAMLYRQYNYDIVNSHQNILHKPPLQKRSCYEPVLSHLYPHTQPYTRKPAYTPEELFSSRKTR